MPNWCLNQVLEKLENFDWSSSEETALTLTGTSSKAETPWHAGPPTALRADSLEKTDAGNSARREGDDCWLQMADGHHGFTDAGVADLEQDGGRPGIPTSHGCDINREAGLNWTEQSCKYGRPAMVILTNNRKAPALYTAADHWKVTFFFFPHSTSPHLSPGISTLLHWVSPGGRCSAASTKPSRLTSAGPCLSTLRMSCRFCHHSNRLLAEVSLYNRGSAVYRKQKPRHEPALGRVCTGFAERLPAGACSAQKVQTHLHSAGALQGKVTPEVKKSSWQHIPWSGLDPLTVPAAHVNNDFSEIA